MRLSYMVFTQDQESPELLPNELVLGLSRITGLPHYKLHRQLLALNPDLEILDGVPHLSAADAAATLTAVDDHFLLALRHMVTPPADNSLSFTL